MITFTPNELFFEYDCKSCGGQLVVSSIMYDQSIWLCCADCGENTYADFKEMCEKKYDREHDEYKRDFDDLMAQRAERKNAEASKLNTELIADAVQGAVNDWFIDNHSQIINTISNALENSFRCYDLSWAVQQAAANWFTRNGDSLRHEIVNRATKY